MLEKSKDRRDAKYCVSTAAVLDPADKPYLYTQVWKYKLSCLFASPAGEADQTKSGRMRGI